MSYQDQSKIKYLLNHICIVAAMPRCEFNTVQTANFLGTTQPNVSKKLRQFEEYVGAPVFTRDKYKHYVGLTPFGKQVFMWCERISDSVSKLDRLRKS